jgi:hypothetical protein
VFDQPIRGVASMLPIEAFAQALTDVQCTMPPLMRCGES